MATLMDTLQVKFEALTRDFERSVAKAFGPRSTMARLGGIVAGAAAAASAAITGLSVKAVSDFSKFETDMATIFRKLPDQTEEMQAAMRDGLRGLSEAYGTPIGQITAATADFVAAIDDVPGSLEFMDIAIRTSIATGEDLGTTVERLDGVFNGFKTVGRDAAEVADIMATAADFGAANFDELGQALAKIVAPALESGTSLEEVTAAITTMTNFNIEAAQAGTMTRNMLNELNDSSKGVGEAFQDLTGQAFPDFIASGGTLEEALQILARAADESGEDLTSMFDSVLSGQAAFLLTGPGAEEFAGALDAVSDSAGYVDRGFGIMSDTIQSKGQTVRALWAGMILDLGERLAPAYETVLDTVTHAFPLIQSTIESVFDGIGAAITWLINMWEVFRGQTSDIWDATLAAADVAAEAFTLVFELLAALWTSVLKPVWEAIEPTVRVIFEGALRVITGVWEAIKGVFNIIIGFLTGDWDRAWLGVEQLFDGVWNAIMAIVWTVGEGIMTLMGGILGFLEGAFTAGWERLVSLVQNVWGHITSGTQEAGENITRRLRGLTEYLRGAFSNAWEATKAAITNVMEGTRANIEAIWGNIRTALEAAASFLGVDFTAAWDALSANLIRIWEGIKGGIENVWSLIQGLLEAAALFLQGDFQGAWAALQAFIEEVWTSVQTNAQGAWEGITSALRGAWEGIRNLAGEAWTGIVDAITRPFEGIGNFFASLWEGIINTIKDALNSVITGINAMIGAWNSLEFRVPEITIPGFGFDMPEWMGGGHFGAGPWTVGGQAIGVPQLPTIPALAEGGIVSEATLALIGEAGPEAVIPLDKLDHTMGGDTTIIIELDGRTLARAVAPRLVNEARLKTGLIGV